MIIIGQRRALRHFVVGDPKTIRVSELQALMSALRDLARAATWPAVVVVPAGAAESRRSPLPHWRAARPVPHALLRPGPRSRLACLQSASPRVWSLARGSPRCCAAR